MPAPRIAAAHALKERVQLALDTAGLTGAIASIDPLDITSGSRNGIVVISPPDLTFTTWTITDATFTLSAIAGPADNLLAAWQRLDEIVEALRVANLDMVDARGDMFAPKEGSPLPGYTITLNPETLID